MPFNISETETFTKHSGDEKNYTLLVIFGLIGPIAIILIIVCIAMACRKHRNALPYSVAVTNSLLKDPNRRADLPCQHCNMIVMGEMACYTKLCPECGKTPPVPPASPSPKLMPKLHCKYKSCVDPNEKD